MRTGRGKIAEQGNVLARLRAGDAGPDPHFRAVLRERLVAAAGDRSADRVEHGRLDHGRHDSGRRNHGRADRPGEADG